MTARRGRSTARLLVLGAALAAVAPARAQDATPPPPPALPQPTPAKPSPDAPPAPGSDAAAAAPRVQGVDAPAPLVGSTGCSKASKAAGPGISAAPVTWNDFEIEGALRDPAETVRALFAPVMSRRSSLTEDARNDIAASALRYGYHLASLSTRDTPTGAHLVLHLAPMPLVRRVDLDIKQSLFDTLLKDQVSRRMRIRAGAYLPYEPNVRGCELAEENARVAEYLHFEEGFFDAKVAHTEEERDGGLQFKFRISLGSEYRTGAIKIARSDVLSQIVDPREIANKFRHKCRLFCIFGSERFTRAQHLEDIKAVGDLMRSRGFPAARVHTSFEQDPASAFNRSTHAVDFTVTIDPRRRLDVQFDGHDPDQLSDESLRQHLTFNTAQSSDDVEANNSAQELVTYLQSRGWFDAHVTWARDRADAFDRITFHIEQGKRRSVRAITFAGNKAFGDEDLEGVIGTTQEKLSTNLFGGNTNATRSQLDGDVEAIARRYRLAGYNDVRVHVEIASDPDALASAALAAALATAERGDGLYIRYVVEEGDPTLLTGVEVAIGDSPELRTPEERALCAIALAELADLHGASAIATPTSPDRCAAQIESFKYRPEDAAATRDGLKDRMFKRGRPRADVTYELVEVAPHRVVARYGVHNTQQLQIGQVVVRGNFRTRDDIIRSELGLRQGRPLTQDALADGARRLRNTALFNAVRVAMPDLETTTAGEVNAVVEVVERDDHILQLDVEVGGSTYSGLFAKLLPSLKNVLGMGISLDTAFTGGLDIARLRDSELEVRQYSVESTLRFPRWLSRRISPIEFQTELTAFYRLQDTPRFGKLNTTGVTVTLSRTWDRKRIGSRPARAITTGVHYDFRARSRQVDALRPVGADNDQTTAPVQTTTGSVGLSFEWEQRVDRQGVLQPLAAEDGFRLEAQASFASNYLGGQDTFVKLSTAASRYLLLGSKLLLRGDIRYDQGIPLGGAVLLPEVERFFAGGDATVRGYDDDRLSTEIVQVGVPPFSNVRQLRILPSGGNIRLMSSLDAQLRIYGVFATAVFADAGFIGNQWSSFDVDAIRPSIGIALFRMVTPFGAFSWERAIPLRPRLGDDPRGRWHISFAARAQF